MDDQVPPLPPMHLGTVRLIPAWVLAGPPLPGSVGLIGVARPVSSAFGDVLPVFTTEDKARAFAASVKDREVRRVSTPAVLLALARHFQAHGVHYAGIDLDPLDPADTSGEHTLTPIAGIIAALGG